MLTAVKTNLAMFFAYFKLNLSSSMAYRTSFLMQTFGMFLNNASFAFFWWLLIERIGTIGGYGFEDVMMLWALSSTGFGIQAVAFGNAGRISEMVLKGEIDSYLLQPKSVLLNLIASRTRISGWGDIIYGIVLFFLIRGFDPVGFLLFLLFSATAAMLFVSVLVTFNSLTLYLGNVATVARLAFEFIITLSIYPATIYRGVIKVIVYSLLPAAFISFVPARLISDFDLKWMGILFIMTAVWVFVAFLTFNGGLRKYESGNLIVQKL